MGICISKNNELNISPSGPSGPPDRFSDYDFDNPLYAMDITDPFGVEWVEGTAELEQDIDWTSNPI